MASIFEKLRHAEQDEEHADDHLSGLFPRIDAKPGEDRKNTEGCCLAILVDTRK
jgi:hypothetical protein